MKINLKYKGVTVNSFGLPVFGADNSKTDKDRNNTKKLGGIGKRYSQYKLFIHNFPINSPKNLIVMYDIPSEKRKERDWFRRHLQKFDYKMIQKSVWVGPSPLPKDFLDYVKSIGILKQIQTLKLAEPYLKENRDF